MLRPASALVSILVVAAGVSGLAGNALSAAAQRIPASREEALAIIGQLTATIDGTGRDNASLLGDRKVLMDASITVDRLLTEFDDAVARATTGYAAIEAELARPVASGENTCEVMASSVVEAAQKNAEVTAGRRAISDLGFETTVPASSCAAGDAVRLRTAAGNLLAAKTKLLASVTDWSTATRTADQARRAVMVYRNTLTALDEMDDIADRLNEVVMRADRGYTDYERWTMSAAPQIAALRKTATKFGIEREVADLEAKAVAGSNEFARLPLSFKMPGFGDRMVGVMKTRKDAAAKRDTLKAASSRFECTAPSGVAADPAALASELAGAVYSMDDTSRTWLATADRCEKKKTYIKHIALETTFATVKVGETLNRPRFLQASTSVLEEPTDVGSRAEWTGITTPFTPAADQGGRIFFVTATLEGRASTLVIFVEPVRSARR